MGVRKVRRRNAGRVRAGRWGREGRPEGGGGGGEGTKGGAARGVPARADRTAAEHTPRGRGAPQQATCAKRADARQGRWRGQAVGLLHQKAVGKREGARGALLAPLDRREEMPTRKVASATGAPVPARAATGRQRRARREAPPEWP